jgi:hypothetical protein
LLKSSLDKIESLRTINMHLGLFNKKDAFTNQLSAHRHPYFRVSPR